MVSEDKESPELESRHTAHRARFAGGLDLGNMCSKGTVVLLSPGRGRPRVSGSSYPSRETWNLESLCL
jgi:hypothetical protein